MRGLRTHEGKRFEMFFAVVQEKANAGGNVFFFDTGEGHDVYLNGMEGEELSGWLIPLDKADEFEKEWENFKEPKDKWDDYYAMVECEVKDDELVIKMCVLPNFD